MQNRFRVTRKTLRATRHWIHSVHRQRSVLNRNHSFGRFPLIFTPTHLNYQLTQTFIYRARDFRFVYVKRERNRLFRLQELI